MGPEPTFGTEKLPFLSRADRNPRFCGANLCPEPTFGGEFEPQTFWGGCKKTGSARALAVLVNISGPARRLPPQDIDLMFILIDIDLEMISP